jgi:hypothetical protein
MLVCAAHVTGWSRDELLDLDLVELAEVVEVALDAGFLERRK